MRAPTTMNPRVRIVLTFGLIAGIAVAAIVAARFRAPSPQTAGDARCLTVATTFYPLTYLAEKIGGPDVRVIQLAPGGIDVHDVQLSPRDVARVRESQLLLMNGQVDAWANQVRADAEANGAVVISMLQALGLSTSANPHIWLDPILMRREIGILVDAFSRAAPSCAGEFRLRGQELMNEVSALDASFRDGLVACRSRDLIVPHDGFRHLADRYGLTTLSLAGSSPEEEPSPRRLAELAEQAREKSISVVFTETLVSSKLAETFAREINARILPLHPLEGLTADEQRRGSDYMSVMRTNLAQLRESLGCLER